MFRKSVLAGLAAVAVAMLWPVAPAHASGTGHPAPPLSGGAGPGGTGRRRR
jgi:hypothetical protein